MPFNRQRHRTERPRGAFDQAGHYPQDRGRMPLVEAPDQIDKELPPGSAESVDGAALRASYGDRRMAGGFRRTMSVTRCSSFHRRRWPTWRRNALALGKKVAADCVLFGSVNKYRERVGFRVLGAERRPAVAVYLELP